MKKLIIFVIIILGIFYIGGSDKTSTPEVVKKYTKTEKTVKKTGCKYSLSGIRIIIDVLGPQYFKNPKSFDLERNSVKVYKTDTKKVYEVDFQAYATNGFGGEVLNNCTAIVKQLPNCDYSLLSLLVND